MLSGPLYVLQAEREARGGGVVAPQRQGVVVTGRREEVGESWLKITQCKTESRLNWSGFLAR